MKPTDLFALMFCALPIVLVGCAAATSAPSPTPMPTTPPLPTATPKPVTLQFIGNSCTLITAPDGTRIVSDPYGNSAHPTGIGPLPKDLVADAVTVSHAHPDHNNVKGVGGTPQLITAPGTFQVGMVKVTGYGGYEGSPSGPSKNPHVVFVFEIDGVKIVHLGDSGPITQPDVLAAIEQADVLLANIDGYVIPADQIVPFIQRAKVRTFIPTHYSLSTGARWQGAPTIDEFIKTLPADLPIVRQGSEIQVTPNMPTQMVDLTSLALIK
jgi:L-ascorbate metabolism protein UlaG (beta-lactamase superfamily)